MKPTCSLCGGSRLIQDANGFLVICSRCVQVTFTTSNSSTAFADTEFHKQLEALRAWNATWHAQREAVPQAFQDAFSEGELEL